jgi:aminocarboxymuconate-semialdehyde decarboxylase
MTDALTIDSHTHILTEEAMRLLAKESPKVAPVVKNIDARTMAIEIDGGIVQNPMPREIWDLDLRLRDMDASDVDMQVLSPTVFTFFYGVEPALALACATLQNEEIAGVIHKHPKRFIGLGTVPLQAPKAAAEELRRAMTKLGLRGAMIGSNANGLNLDDPTFEPFWAAAEELGAFIFIHPHAVAGGERLGSYYLRNFVGLPFETTIAAASLVFGGVFERHPGLKVCLSHGGGFVPYQLGRFQHGFEVRSEARVKLSRPLSESLGRLYYDTIVHSAPTLDHLIDTVGPERVLLGSDYPFDMANFDCVARVRTLRLDPEVRDFILGGYGRKLLGETTGSAHG